MPDIELADIFATVPAASLGAGDKALVRKPDGSLKSTSGAGGSGNAPWEIRCGDRLTPIPAANNVQSGFVPANMSVAEIIAYLTDPTVTGTFTVRMKINGSTVLSTDITIDAGEKSSFTAVTPAEISNDTWLKGDEYQVDVVNAGDGTASGLILYVVPGDAVEPDTEDPSVPAGLAIDDLRTTEADLSWDAATDNIAVAGYTLQWALDAGFTSGVVTQTLGNVLSYTATGLSPSTTYYFRVKARDAAANESAYSTSVNGTTDAPPAVAAGAVYDWDVASLSALANDDPVATWTDGESSKAATAAGSERPTYKTGITPTGAPCVRFDGVDDHLLTTDGDLTAQHIFIVAAQRGAGPNTDGRQPLITIPGIYPFYAESSSTSFQYGSDFGTMKVNGVVSEEIAFGGVFAIYEIELTTDPAPGAWDMAIDGTPAFGDFDICRILAYPNNLSAPDSAATRAALEALYITP